MESYIILVNDGIFNTVSKEGVNSRNVFNREEIDLIFNDWCGGEKMIDWGGIEYSIDDLIGYGNVGEKVDIYNENMVEMGDDFVSISIVKLNK